MSDLRSNDPRPMDEWNRRVAASRDIRSSRAASSAAETRPSRDAPPPSPRRSLALLAFVVVVGNLAAIGAWHVLRWLTLAAVALAQGWGL